MTWARDEHTPIRGMRAGMDKRFGRWLDKQSRAELVDGEESACIPNFRRLRIYSPRKQHAEIRNQGLAMGQSVEAPAASGSVTRITGRGCRRLRWLLAARRRGGVKPVTRGRSRAGGGCRRLRGWLVAPTRGGVELIGIGALATSGAAKRGGGGWRRLGGFVAA